MQRIAKSTYRFYHLSIFNKYASTDQTTPREPRLQFFFSLRSSGEVRGEILAKLDGETMIQHTQEPDPRTIPTSLIKFKRQKKIWKIRRQKAEAANLDENRKV